MTPEDRQRCAETKTIHGNETRQARTDRVAAMRSLRALEDLGHELAIMHGPRMPGRKPHEISESFKTRWAEKRKKLIF